MIYFVTNQEILFEDEDIKKSSLQQCMDYFKDKDIIEVDTETEYCSWDNEKDSKKRRLPDPYTSKVFTLQLGDAYNQYVIECADTDFIRYIKPLFEDETKIKIFTNGFFDIRFFLHWNIDIKNVCDIFLQEMILTRGMTKPKGYRSLEGMCQRYLGIQLNKEVRGQIHWRGLDKTVIKYAAEDVQHMNKIRLLQIEQLTKLGLLEYARLENLYVIELARVSYKGFKIDTSKWLEHEISNKKLLEQCRNNLDNWIITNLPKFSTKTLFGTECNIKWTSSDQVKPVMKELGINIEVRDKNTGEDKESVELKILQKQIDKSTLLPIYIRYKELAKEITTYGKTFLTKNLNPVTNRVHTEFFQILETGRISSTKPNIQNIPGEIEGNTHPLRLAFTTEKDHVFVVCDYSQQEPRITAEYSQDPYLIDFILNGSGDSHSLIATMISEYLLGEHIEVTKHNNPFVQKFGKSIRAIGKTINLGKDYGKSAYTTAPDLGISIEEAEKLFQIIDSKTPKKIKYFKKWQQFVHNNGYIITDNLLKSITWFDKYEEYKMLYNLTYDKRTSEQNKRFFKLKGQLERFAQNNRIQGTAALMTKIAHIYIIEDFRKYNIMDKAFIVGLVHDEIISECHKDYAKLVAKIMQENMIKAGELFCKTIPMKVDPEISKLWEH